MTFFFRQISWDSGVHVEGFFPLYWGKFLPRGQYLLEWVLVTWEILISVGFFPVAIPNQVRVPETNTISYWPNLFVPKTSFNLNIYYYFINTLASSNNNTWNHRGGTITQTTDYIGLNPNHWRSVVNTCKTIIGCIEQGVKYTVINGTKIMVDLNFCKIL